MKFNGKTRCASIWIFFLLVSGCAAEAPAEKALEVEPVKEAVPEQVADPIVLEEVEEEPEPNPHGFVESSELTKDEALLALFERLTRKAASKKDVATFKGKKKKWLEAVYGALKHKEPNLRSNSAALLCRGAKSKRTTKILMERLEAEPDGDVRSQIAKELVKYKEKATVPTLIKVMRGDENASARANAAWALSKIGDASCAQAFREALTDPESWVRFYAVSGVKKLRVKKAIPSLRILLSDPSDLVAKKARETMKSLGAR